jgi:hypothetical protein
VVPSLTAIYWCDWFISWFLNRAFVMNILFAFFLMMLAIGVIGNLASVFLGEHAWVVAWGAVLLMGTTFAFELVEVFPYVSASAISFDSSFFAGGLVGLFISVAIQLQLIRPIRVRFRS